MTKFVAIGDIVTDTFIKLKDATVHCDINSQNCTITMRFGDKIPYESVEVVNAVGNAPNAAVSAARLGLSSAMVTDLGVDELGKKCIESLEKDNVDTQFVTSHPGQESNSHYVLSYDADRTILIKHQKYAYKLPDIGEPEWVYFSSVGEDSLEYHKQIVEYLNAHPKINLAFQPGTFQMKIGKEKLAEVYKRAKITFCNVEEAERILGIKTLGTEELLKRMHELGPEIVVITDGPRGAYAYDGTNIYFQTPYPDPKPPLERTGAGDAFSSTTAVAIALGKDLPTALSWGAVNSMSVVQQVGAQKGLLTREKLEAYLAQAPAGFETKKLK